MTPNYFKDMQVVDERLCKLEERVDKLSKAIDLIKDLLRKLVGELKL